MVGISGLVKVSKKKCRWYMPCCVVEGWIIVIRDSSNATVELFRNGDGEDCGIDQ